MNGHQIGLAFEGIPLLLSISLAPTLMAVPASRGASSQINIRVVDFAHVPEAIFSHAEIDAARILTKAGVDVRWLDCRVADFRPDNVCNQDLGPLDFWIRIVPAIPRGMKRDTFGYVTFDPLQRTGKYANVLYERGKDVAETSRADVFTSIGAAMAHEIGHLLLGPSHTSKSIMSARWRHEELQQLGQGSLLFTREQALALRVEIARLVLATEKVRDTQRTAE